MVSVGLGLGRIPVIPVLDARLRPIWRVGRKTGDDGLFWQRYISDNGFILPTSNIYPENQEEITGCCGVTRGRNKYYPYFSAY
jgi:hypothetical protein